MITAALIGLGGMVGALLRFAVDKAFEAQRARRRHSVPPKPPFPAGTLVVNTVGSLLIGFVWGALKGAAVGTDGYAVWATGFAGGLTTFSTLSVATVTLWQGRRPIAASFHLTANLVLGWGAAMLGLVISGTV